MKNAPTLVTVPDDVKVSGDVGVKIPSSFTLANDEAHPVVIKSKPDDILSRGWLNSETGAGWVSGLLTLAWAIVTFFVLQRQGHRQQAFQEGIAEWQKSQALSQENWQKRQAEIQRFDSLLSKIATADNTWRREYLFPYKTTWTESFDSHGHAGHADEVADEAHKVSKTSAATELLNALEQCAFYVNNKFTRDGEFD